MLLLGLFPILWCPIYDTSRRVVIGRRECATRRHDGSVTSRCCVVPSLPCHYFCTYTTRRVARRVVPSRVASSCLLSSASNIFFPPKRRSSHRPSRRAVARRVVCRFVRRVAYCIDRSTTRRTNRRTTRRVVSCTRIEGVLTLSGP